MNHKSYFLEMQNIINSIPGDQRQTYIATFIEREKNPVTSFGLSAFLGAIGADRFYIGDIWLGIFKLITIGGLGLWFLIDLIIIAGTTRDKNIMLARALKDSFKPTTSV